MTTTHTTTDAGEYPPISTQDVEYRTTGFGGMATKHELKVIVVQRREVHLVNQIPVQKVHIQGYCIGCGWQSTVQNPNEMAMGFEWRNHLAGTRA